MADEDYKVGYGQPPLHSRFPKGRSGNPKGRPRGSRSFKVEYREELEQRITININGRPRKISKRRALLMALVNNGIKGNLRAAAKAVDLDIRHLSGEDDATTSGQPLSEAERAILDALFKRRVLSVDRSEQPDRPTSDGDRD